MLDNAAGCWIVSIVFFLQTAYNCFLSNEQHFPHCQDNLLKVILLLFHSGQIFSIDSQIKCVVFYDWKYLKRQLKISS